MIRSKTLTDDLLQQIIDHYLRLTVTVFDRQRSRQPIFPGMDIQQRLDWEDQIISDCIETDTGFDMYVETQEYSIEKHRKALGRMKGHELPEITRAADFYIKHHGLPTQEGTTEYTHLCNEMLKAKIKAESVKVEHLKGNYDTDYDVEMKSRKASLTLKEMITLYETEKMPSWSDPARLLSTHRQILHIIGNKRLDTIDRKAAIEFRDALKEYPAKLSAKDMDTPWKELAKKKKTRLSEGSQHFILTEFSTLIKYAKEHELGVKGSPATGLVGKKEDVKRVKVRVPLSSDELQRMIGVLAGVDREKEPETFWIPLLLLYTGARSNDVCMLRTEDVEVRGESSSFCFRNRPEHNQRTKSSKDRQTPVHQDLVRLGFLKYVEAQKSKGKGRLFDNLVLYREKWNVYYGKDFNRTFKRKFLIGYSTAELSARDLHTFRVTMISWFIQRKDLATIPNISILQSMVGHLDKQDISTLIQFIQDSKLTIDGYGQGYGKEHEQNELLQKLDYGLDLSPLL